MPPIQTSNMKTVAAILTVVNTRLWDDSSFVNDIGNQSKSPLARDSLRDG